MSPHCQGINIFFLCVGDTTYEELAISQLMETYSTGKLVFERIKQDFELNEITLKNLIGIATDGASSMIGRQRRFITCFKKLNPELFTIHYVIRRQHLVAKILSVRLHN